MGSGSRLQRTIMLHVISVALTVSPVNMLWHRLLRSILRSISQTHVSKAKFWGHKPGQGTDDEEGLVREDADPHPTNAWTCVHFDRKVTRKLSACFDCRVYLTRACYKKLCASTRRGWFTSLVTACPIQQLHTEIQTPHVPMSEVVLRGVEI